MADIPSSQDMILGEMRGQLRELVHTTNNLSMKFDALSREVIGLGPLATDIAELKGLNTALMGRVASLELEQGRREGAQGVLQTILKSPVVAWLVAGIAATWAVVTGKVQI